MIISKVLQDIQAISEGMLRPVYRGQRNVDWELESTAVRRLKDVNNENLLDEIKEYQTGLLARLKIIESRKQPDEQMLAELQHHGAATMLLDFSESPLVALWFACSEETNADMIRTDGKVYVVDIGDSTQWTDGRNVRWLSDGGKLPESYYFYEPEHSLSVRIAAQQSVFLIACPQFPDELVKEVKVPVGNKATIRVELEWLGVSEKIMFADLPGLATIYGPNTPLRAEKSVTKDESELKRSGERSYHKKDFDKALINFQSYARKRPNVAEPHWLVGNALSGLKKYERAIESYTKAIDLKDNPIHVENAQVMTWVINFHLATCFFNRGNAYAAIARHDNAIDDYTSALNKMSSKWYQPENILKMHTLYNRANSYFSREEWQKAFNDFDEAGGSERSEIYLGMGNCKVKMGKYGQAKKIYSLGIDKEPKSQSRYCRINMEAVKGLIDVIGEHVAHSRFDGSKVAVNAEMPSWNFEFKGNRGNCGNWGGGPGYHGLKDFIISTVAPSQ